jgi:hypothetical protein
MRHFIIEATLSVIFLSYAPFTLAQQVSQASASQRDSKHTTKVDVKYDKKKDLTTVWLKDLTLWKNPITFEQINMSVSFDYPKHIIVLPNSVLITIYSASKWGTLFENESDLIVIADNIRLSLGKMGREGEPNSALSSSATVFYERLKLAIPYENFSRIAKANKVEVRIGGRPYNLTDKQLQSLNDLLELMQQEGHEFK